MSDENIKLLFIDDDELSTKAFARRLERRGFSVTVFTNGLSALAALDKEKFDLVLLDIVMPETDGISVLKQIREKYPIEVLPVIMVTVSLDSSDIVDSFQYGANDYITKPLHIDAAAARINGQLSASRLHRLKTKLREVEAVAAVVTTYHHEINNPLAIIKSELQSMAKQNPDLDKVRVDRVFRALERIQTTLGKLKEISEKNEIQFETYAHTTKMINTKG